METGHEFRSTFIVPNGNRCWWLGRCGNICGVRIACGLCVRSTGGGPVACGHRFSDPPHPTPSPVAVTFGAETVGAQVLPIQELEVVKAVPEERVSERIVAQVVRVERIQDRIADQIVAIPVPLVMEGGYRGSCAGGEADGEDPSTSEQGGNRGGASARGLRSTSKTSCGAESGSSCSSFIEEMMKVHHPSSPERHKNISLSRFWASCRLRYGRRSRRCLSLYFRSTSGNESRSVVWSSIFLRSRMNSWRCFNLCTRSSIKNWSYNRWSLSFIAR